MEADVEWAEEANVRRRVWSVLVLVLSMVAAVLSVGLAPGPVRAEGGGVLADLDATAMRTALEASSDFATGEGSLYAALVDTGRRNSVSVDMVGSRPSGGYDSTGSAQAMFNGLVAFRTEVQLAVNAANQDSGELDLSRLHSLVATTSALLPLGAQLNDELVTQASVDVLSLLLEVNGPKVVHAINAGGGSYASFSQMMAIGLAGVVFVDPATAQSPGSGTMTAPFKSLDSVRASGALAGKHTVMIGDGEVTLDGPLILEAVSMVGAGSGAGGTTISYAASTGFDGIRVRGDGVTLKGFTLTAAGRTPNSTGRGYGVKTAPGVTNLTVEDVRIVDVERTAFDVNSIVNAVYRNITVSAVSAGFALAIGGPARNVTVSSLTVEAMQNGLSSAAWGDVGVYPWPDGSIDKPTGVRFEAPMGIRSIALQPAGSTLSAGTSFDQEVDVVVPEQFDHQLTYVCGDVLTSVALPQASVPTVAALVPEECVIPSVTTLPTPVEVVRAGVSQGRFNTVKGAIAAATSGDTIRVGAGSYNESVTVNKRLTILGPNAGVSPVTGDGWVGQPEAAVTGSGDYATFTFSQGSSGSVLRGLTIQESAGGNSRAGVEGRNGADDVLIQRNRFVVTKVGVYASAPGYSGLSGWWIDDNLVAPVAGSSDKAGMNLWHVGDVTVSANRVIGLPRGLQFEGSSGPQNARWVIADNVIENSAVPGLQIASVQSQSQVIVTGNVLTNNNWNLANDGYSGALRIRGKNLSTAQFVVSENTFTGNAGSAIMWGHDTDITVSASNATISGNTFNIPTGSYAVSYASLSNQTLNLRGNTWRVCGDSGVEGLTRLLATPKVGGSIPTGVTLDIAEATVTGCQLTNTTAVSQRSGAVTLSVQTDAGAGATVAFFLNGLPRGTATTNASGIATVSAVLAPGTYQVSVSSPNAAAPTPVTLNVFGRSVCASGCEHSTIQAAINAASTYETVTVGAGTYTLSSTLNLNEVSLQGAGSDPDGTVIVPGTAAITAIALSGGTATAPVRLAGVSVSGFSTNISAGGAAQIRGVVSSHASSYALTLTTSDSVSIEDSSFTYSKVGMRVGSGVKVSGVRVRNAHFEDNLAQGWYIAQENASGAQPFDDVVVEDSSFNRNFQKGLYFERASNLVLRRVTVDGSGVDPAYIFNNGIDLNLKWRDYSNIVLDGVTITNSGVTTAALARTPSQPWFSSALAIKARDDGDYALPKASLTGLTILNSTIDGLENGIVFGEPGKLVAGASGLVLANNTITASECAVVNTSVALIPAAGNWWGSASPEFVNQGTCRSEAAGAVNIEPILDGPNGNPVLASGSILLTVRDASGNGVPGVTVGATSRAEQVTGADGRVTFAGLGSGTFTVTVSVGAAYTLVGQPSRLVNLAAGQAAAVDFSVVGVGSITGTVTDTSGVGVVGVVVSASNQTATTDASGRYTLTGLSVGSYTVTLPATLPAGYTAAGPTARQVNLAAGQAATADFVLAQASSITGRVTDRNGTGVAGVTVTLTPPQGSSVTRVTDSEGRYRFTGRTVFGLHTVAVTVPTGYVAGGPASTTVNLAAGQLATTDFVIVPTGVIAGRVQDTSGLPVAGVVVALDRACVGSTTTSTTDLAGRYSFTGCTVAGTFQVTATPPTGFVAAGPATRTVNRPDGGSVGADFALAETSSIVGRVVDSAGVGVSGIVVTLRAPGGASFASSITDLEGRFRFASLSTFGVYTATIAATGLPSGFTLAGPAERAVNLASGQSAQVQFTLAQTSSIGGAVLDTSGAPVAGVTVRLDPVNSGDAVTLVTGADGRFVRAGLTTTGAYDVIVTVPEGFVSAGGETTRVNLAAGATAQASFTLARTSSIGGVVIDSSGAPLSGISVRVAAVGGIAVDLVTGVDGRYVAIGLVATGAYDVAVTVPSGFAAIGATTTRVNLASGASATADFSLARTSSVVGRVVDASGVGVAGVTVTVSAVGGATQVVRSSDVEGRFAATGLASGAYDVTMGVPTGFVAGSAVMVRANLTGGAAGVDFRVTRTSSITGRVVDDAERGIAGVEVTLTGGSVVRSMRTDVTGRFDFVGLTAALYEVTVPATVALGLPSGFSPSGATSRNVFLASDRAATTEFVLARSSAISGRVVDTVGNAVAGVPVTLTPASGSGDLVRSTGLDGRFSVAGLTSGVYDVAMRVPDGFSAGGSATSRVNLIAGSSAVADFTVARQSTIAGRVVDLAGNPVAGVAVTLSGAGSATTATGTDGTYAFPSLVSTGQHSVTATVPVGFAAVGPTSRVVNLASGQSATASFTIAELGLVSGRIIDNTGAGVAGVTVTVSATVSTQTDLDGRYRFSGLQTGTSVTVWVTLPASYVQPTGQDLLQQDIAVGSSAEEVVLLPPGTVSGFAYIDLNGNDERDAGEPALAGVVATLSPSGATATTSANGFYRFDGAQAGSTVDFASPIGFVKVSGTVVSAARRSTIRPLNEGSTAFLRDVGLLGVGTLAGYVTLDGQPLAGVSLTVGAQTVSTSTDGVALFGGLSGEVTMTLIVPDGFALARGTAARTVTVGSGSPVQTFALEVVQDGDGGSTPSAPPSGGGGTTTPGEIRQTLEVRPVGVTPITVTTPDGPVQLRFSGIAVASGSTPEVVVRTLGYATTARGVQAAGPRFRLTAERFDFDEVEVCVPVDNSAVRGAGRSTDRIRLVHTRLDGTEHDITTRLDLTGTTGEVCGVAETFSTFQAAIVVSDRVAGDDRYDTAARTARQLYPAGARTVYVATGVDFADALAAGAAAAAADAPLLLVRPDQVPAETRTALRRLDPTSIVLVGGTQAVTARVEAQLASIASATVTRVAGADRYATAAQLALTQFPAGVATLYVATGVDFPDALAAGAAATRSGAALLLVPGEGLPDSVREALVALAPQRIVLVGGTAAVSAATERALRGVATQVDRVGGVDRFDTAARLTTGMTTGGTLVVVTGSDFPDALVATALATRRGGSVLLVAGTAPSATTQRRATELAPTAMVVVGGGQAVSATAELRLVRALPAVVPTRL